MYGNAIRMQHLSESSGFSLPFQQCQDVSLSDRTLHVTNDRAILVIQELYADLAHVTSVTGAAQNLCNSCKLGWNVHFMLLWILANSRLNPRAVLDWARRLGRDGFDD